MIDKEMRVVNETRLYNHPPMTLKLSADPAVRPVSGETGIMESIDYRGKNVLTAYTYLKDMGLAMECKQDLFELYWPIRQLIRSYIFISIASLIGIYVIALLVSRSLSEPLTRMKIMAHRIATGNFVDETPIKERDEAGELFHSLYKMQKVIRERQFILSSVRDISQGLTGVSTIEEFCPFFDHEASQSYRVCNKRILHPGRA